MERIKAEELFEQEKGRADEGGSIRSYAQAAVRAMNEHAAQGDFLSARAAVNALWELGDFQRENKNYSGAEKSFKRMEKLCIELPEEFCGKESNRWLAVSCNKLGSLCERNGNAAQAQEYYSRALEISERIAAEDNSLEARDDLAVANYRLGFIDYLFSGEKSRLDKAYAIWTELYEQTGNYEYRRRRSVIDTLCATAEVPQEQGVSEAEVKGKALTAENGKPNITDTVKKERKKSGVVVITIVGIAIIAALLAVGALLLLR